MTDVSRNPRDYHPTVHAIDRAKTRGISFEVVAETIREGEVRPSHKDGCVLFVREFLDKNKPIGVVANRESGEVITVEHRKD